MVIIHIIGFISILCCLSRRLHRPLLELIPIVYSIVLLILYSLAFFNVMYWIDAIMFVCCCITIIYLRFGINNICFKPNDKYTFFLWLLITFTGMCLLCNRGFTSGDDFNFWAVDLKTLFYRNGFSPKHLQCVIGYGDYPPIIQISQYYILHLAGQFDSGLSMSALFLTFMVYIAPLFIFIPQKFWSYVHALPFVFTLGTWGPYMFINRSPDSLMAVVFGCCLCLIYFEQNYEENFGILISIILAILVITKSIGIQWFIFAILFAGIICNKRKKILVLIPIPIFTYLSWNIFCNVMERRTYLTDTLINSVNPVRFEYIDKEDIQLETLFYLGDHYYTNKFVLYNGSFPDGSISLNNLKLNYQEIYKLDQIL